MSDYEKIELPAHLPLKRGVDGELCVETARDILNELIERGYGDFELYIGYDSNYGVTTFTDDIIANGKEKKVWVLE